MIVFCWRQLPVYAARCIGAFAKASGEKVVVLRVVTSRFPIKGAAEMTGGTVIDVAGDDPRSIKEIVGEIPRAIVVGGWLDPSFVRWAKEVKAAGGFSVLNSDEAFTNKGLKQFLRKWRFKLTMQRHYDKFFIVGEGGRLHFGEYWGIPESKLVRGLYAGDPILFHDGAPLKDRPKKFIYVGHYDANKNVLRMCEAFELAVKSTGMSDWSLEVYGGGELAEELKKRESANVHIHGFIQADQLGPLYREARGFVLGSYSDKWGVVVHEAALSGCMLLLSNQVGARYDFAREENAAVFAPNDTNAFASGFAKLMRFNEAQLECAHSLSLKLAERFSPSIFAANLIAALPRI